jgi:hypothetical protein
METIDVGVDALVETFCEAMENVANYGALLEIHKRVMLLRELFSDDQWGMLYHYFNVGLLKTA